MYLHSLQEFPRLSSDTCSITYLKIRGIERYHGSSEAIKALVHLKTLILHDLILAYQIDTLEIENDSLEDLSAYHLRYGVDTYVTYKGYHTQTPRYARQKR